jgi:hypothetical protein
MGRKIGRSILGIIGGFLAASGLWAYLTQTGTIDPASKTGLAFPIVGVLLGLIVGIAGPLRKRRAKQSAPPAEA